jgi:hypothetical protein
MMTGSSASFSTPTLWMFDHEPAAEHLNGDRKIESDSGTVDVNPAFKASERTSGEEVGIQRSKEDKAAVRFRQPHFRCQNAEGQSAITIVSESSNRRAELPGRSREQVKKTKIAPPKVCEKEVCSGSNLKVGVLEGLQRRIIDLEAKIEQRFLWMQEEYSRTAHTLRAVAVTTVTASEDSEDNYPPSPHEAHPSEQNTMLQRDIRHSVFYERPQHILKTDRLISLEIQDIAETDLMDEFRDPSSQKLKLV